MAAIPPMGGAAVFQTAHLVHEPWLPGWMGQMAPDLSIRPDGFTVFSYPGGPSAHGWYQTRLPPVAVAGLLETVMGPGRLPELGRAFTADDLVLHTGAEGFPDPGDPVAIVVIYARTGDGEARAIFDAADLSRRTGAYLAARRRLDAVLAALDMWRSRAGGPVPEPRAAEAESVLGWWDARIEAYTPDGAVLYGTRAPAGVPPDTPARPWPLADDLLGAFDIAAGERPGARFLSQTEAEVLLRSSPAPRDRRWASLWQGRGVRLAGTKAASPPVSTPPARSRGTAVAAAAGSPVAPGGTMPRPRYLIGVRPVVAGGNRVAFSPVFEAPPVYWRTPAPPVATRRDPGVAAPTPTGHR